MLILMFAVGLAGNTPDFHVPFLGLEACAPPVSGGPVGGVLLGGLLGPDFSLAQQKQNNALHFVDAPSFKGSF